MSLVGPRVTLRQWIESDLASLAAMNADCEGMTFFPECLTSEQSIAFFEKQKRCIRDRGWGLWAVEINGKFAGFTGLAQPAFEAHFTPCVEIGWRFHKRFWQQGYGLEAARLALRYGFERLQLREVVSFTARLNVRSQRLMQRLGMTRVARDDFDHPKLPGGHPLRDHVLYRIANTDALLVKLNRELDAQNGEAQLLKP